MRKKIIAAICSTIIATAMVPSIAAAQTEPCSWSDFECWLK